MININQQKPTVDVFLINLFIALPFVFLYNSIVKIEPNFKFSIIISILTIANIIHYLRTKKQSNTYIKSALVFMFFYLVAIVRVNYVIDNDSDDGGTFLSVSQAIVFLYIFLSVIYCESSINIGLYLRNIAVICIIMMMPIVLNINDLTDYKSKDFLFVGDFSYGSYQNTSFLFGLTSLIFHHLAVKSKKVYQSVVFGIFSIICLYTMSYFPARGEAVGALIANLIMLSPRIFLLFSPFVYYAGTYLIVNSDTVLTNRMRSVYEGNFGLRDYLFERSASMSINNIDVLLFGRGVNAFQNYYQVPISEYPHNIFLESVNSGGILLLFFYFLIFLLPVIRMVLASVYKKIDKTQLIYMSVSIYILLIISKSGTMISAWPLAFFAFLFLRCGQIADKAKNSSMKDDNQDFHRT